MHALVKWLGIIVSSAALTFVLFAVFSQLLTPDKTLLGFDAKATGSTIALNKVALEKEPVLYASKISLKYTPLYRPVPLDFCYYPIFELPEQVSPIPEIPKPNFDVSVNFSAPIINDGPSTCREVPLTRRFTPAMPKDATKSGHCVVEFQLDAKGGYIHVRVVSCSEHIFAQPSIKAVQKWQYPVCYPDRSLNTTLNRETVITYRLLDENGDVIPE